MSTVLEMIRTLEPELRRHVSDIHIVAGRRQVTAHLCIAAPGAAYDPAWANALQDADTGSALSRVGGGARRYTRCSDQVLPVGLEEQLHELEASGLVGRLNLTRLEHDGLLAEEHWLVKTHASSRTERLAWRQSL